MLLPRLLCPLLPLLLLAPEPCNAGTGQLGSRSRSEGRGADRNPTEPLGFTGYAAPRRANRSNPEGQLGDPKHKEKFITHLTGPLFFKPQCRRQFHRLYHNTRDCTIPAYYKRCARLLTQLAKSPRCAER